MALRPSVIVGCLQRPGQLDWLAARIGRERLLVASVVLSAFSILLLPAPVPIAVMAVVVLAGFGLGAGQPLTMSWLATSTPLGLRGRAMALRLTGNRLGQIVVPTTAGLFAAGSGPAGVLVLTAGALGAAALTATTLVSKESR
ncbi:MFS transporter [Cryptosporangium sp. NPDC051539]|uniref:MFS transporter n=1 Tax=Cryptosporangium sp. NPDC051539 TaxID=3363962 RepID=UPI0037995020